MALLPTNKEVKNARNKASRDIKKKLASQKKQGKDFEYDPQGHGSGVIPETLWKKLKKEPENE